MSSTDQAPEQTGPAGQGEIVTTVLGGVSLKLITLKVQGARRLCIDSKGNRYELRNSNVKSTGEFATVEQMKAAWNARKPKPKGA